MRRTVLPRAKRTRGVPARTRPHVRLSPRHGLRGDRGRTVAVGEERVIVGLLLSDTKEIRTCSMLGNFELCMLNGLEF